MKTVGERLAEHKHAALNRSHLKLHSALRVENYECESHVMYVSPDGRDLADMERQFIEWADSFRNGLNMTEGGEGEVFTGPDREAEKEARHEARRLEREAEYKQRQAEAAARWSAEATERDRLERERQERAAADLQRRKDEWAKKGLKERGLGLGTMLGSAWMVGGAFYLVFLFPSLITWVMALGIAAYMGNLLRQIYQGKDEGL